MGVSKGYPTMDGEIMENPFKMDDLGVTLFSIYVCVYIYIYMGWPPTTRIITFLSSGITKNLYLPLLLGGSHTQCMYIIIARYTRHKKSQSHVKIVVISDHHNDSCTCWTIATFDYKISYRCSMLSVLSIQVGIPEHFALNIHAIGWRMMQHP